ncbi:MAG: preprotein translocase subunit YajC [Christensenellaceae bacterium]|nr:preprotein translocase subunit YajC [Christensenellaceae bacterium]
MVNLFLEGFDPSLIVMGVLLVLMVAMMFWQGNKAKKQQQDYLGLLDSLRIGNKVIMKSGVIGRIVEIKEEAPGFKTIKVRSGEDSNASVLVYDINSVAGIVNEDALNAISQQSMKQEDKGGPPPRQEDKTTKLNGENLSKSKKSKAKKSS